MILVNNDDSGMSESEAVACRAGLAELAEDYNVVPADTEAWGGSFSIDDCPCCDGLPGDRVDVLLVPTREDQLS